MTLQQLRYAIQVALSGSMTSAATSLYMAQSSLSKAIAELEQEMGITIFERTPGGMVPTDDGERFLSYARDVVDQADLLEARYKNSYGPRHVFTVSSPHNILVTEAFAEVVSAHGNEFFQFALREERASVIIESVHAQHCELGVLYRSPENANHIDAAAKAAGLVFEPVAWVKPVALVACSALTDGRTPSSIDDLRDLPRIVLGSLVDETVGSLGKLLNIRDVPRRVVVGDWETAIDLVVRLGGYTISLGDAGPARKGVSVANLEGLRPVELGVLSRAGMLPTPAARDFCSALMRLAN